MPGQTKEGIAVSKERKRIKGKDALIKKLKEELKEKEQRLKEGKKSLLDQAKENLLRLEKKFEAELKDKTGKLAGQKDGLIKKLKKELADKGEIIEESVKTLKETAETAGREVAAFKEKTTKSLMELKGRAESEAQKMKEELETKSQALRGKMDEMEEYRKGAENKIFGLQAKVKEYAAKFGLTDRERTGLVTFKRNPMTLLGLEVKVGDKAPDFQVIDNTMKAAALESFRGKIKIITSVPSLDTPVCNMETRRFNEEAGKLAENVAVVTISMDLPFAQSRWCAAAGVEKVKTFSDYQGHSFGLAYGVLLKELKLLSRAVFIVDDQDIVRYVELVPEITREPDYERVLSAVRALI